MEIRKGTDRDIPRALELIRELAVFERAPGEVEVSADEMREWGFGADPQFELYVAEENGVVVGIAVCYFKYSTWKGKCLFLEDIIVTQSMRGKGIGTRLFDRVVARAKEAKVRRLEWQVLEWNEDAIRFYKRYSADLDSTWINCRLTPAHFQRLPD